MSTTTTTTQDLVEITKGLAGTLIVQPYASSSESESNSTKEVVCFEPIQAEFVERCRECIMTLVRGKMEDDEIVDFKCDDSWIYHNEEEYSHSKISFAEKVELTIYNSQSTSDLKALEEEAPVKPTKSCLKQSQNINFETEYAAALKSDEVTITELFAQMDRKVSYKLDELNYEIWEVERYMQVRNYNDRVDHPEKFEDKE